MVKKEALIRHLVNIFNRLSIARRAIKIGLIIFMLVIMVPAPALSSSKFVCTSDKKEYLSAAECVGKCKRRLANLGRCVAKVNCTELRADPDLESYYNRILFQPVYTPVPITDADRIAFVKKLLKTYYHEAKFKDITIGKTEEKWASILCESCGKDCSLFVARDLFRGPSLPFIVSTLGHEFIHMRQKQRCIKADVSIDRAITAFFELEASLWDTGTSGYTWDLAPSGLINCFTSYERKEAEDTLNCRKWEVNHQIDFSMDNPRSSVSAPALERWLNDNWWTKKNWLPQNKDWKKYKSGVKPADCD